MNATPTQHTADDLDKLFSAFFKAQVQQPWPKAPTPAASQLGTAPSGLVTARAAERVRNAPGAPARPRDHAARARFTLAASVALLLGAGWLLSDGFPPAGRSIQGPGPANNAPGFLPGGTADGQDHLPLKKMGEDKAKGGNGDITIDAGRFE